MKRVIELAKKKRKPAINAGIVKIRNFCLPSDETHRGNNSNQDKTNSLKTSQTGLRSVHIRSRCNPIKSYKRDLRSTVGGRSYVGTFTNLIPSRANKGNNLKGSAQLKQGLIHDEGRDFHCSERLEFHCILTSSDTIITAKGHLFD